MIGGSDMQKNRRSGKVDFRRVLAAVLCFAMMVSYMPSTVVAAEIMPGEEFFTEETADSFDTDNSEDPEVTDAYSGADTEGEEIADDMLPSEEAADDAAAAEEMNDGEEMADGEEPDDFEYSEDIEAVEEYDEELMNADPVGEPDSEQGEDPKTPAFECGQYYVRVNRGVGIPDGVNPAISMAFNTQYPVDYSKTMEAAADIPYDGETAPDRLIFSISKEDYAYFASGRLEIRDDSGEIIDEIDFFDKIRKNASVNDKYMYTYEGVDTSYKYEVNVTFSYTRSVSWSYLEQDRGSDRFVENCKIYLIYEEGKGLPEIEGVENGDDMPVMDAGRQGAEGYADYQLLIGETYHFRLVPDMGYQVAGLMINGYEVAPADAAHPGVFAFTMEDHNFHMNSVVEPVGSSLYDISAQGVGYFTVDGKSVSELENVEALAGKFDENMGGSLMIEVEDQNDDPVKYSGDDVTWAADTKPEDKETAAGMIPENTLEIDISQAVAQGRVEDNPEYWQSAITELDKEIELEFVYPGQEGNQYLVATEHEGTVSLIPAEYKGDKLSFSTKEFSRFTILRSGADTDDVVFNFEHVQGTDKSLYPFEFEYRLTPVQGLEAYDPGLPISGETYWYNYSGNGDIVLKVEKKVEDTFVNPTKEDLTKLTERCIVRLAGFFKSYEEQKEPPLYFAEHSAEGTYITVPAISGDHEHPFPILDMMELALDQCGDGKQAMVTLSADSAFDGFAKQVEPTKKDSVKYDFSLGEVQYDDRIYPGSNVEKIDEKDLTWYAIGDEDRIFFKADPIGEGVVIEDIIYRVIESRDEYGEIVNVPRSDYPQGKAELIDAEKGIYTISVPRNKDGDWGSVLGLRLEPMTSKMTRVEVNFDKDYFHEKEPDWWKKAFDVTVRAGGREYIVSPQRQEGEEGFSKTAVAYVPAGETVSVKIASVDGFDKVSGARATDAKRNAQAVTPDKNGEYVLYTTDKTTVSLDASTEPVAKIQLYWFEDEEVEYGDVIHSENGKYLLGHYEIFEAKLGCGSEYDESENEFMPIILKDAVYKDGAATISQGVNEGVLRATGNTLGKAGKTMTLTASSGTISASVSIGFTAAVTADNLKVEGSRDGVITLPYGAETALKVTLPKGAYSPEIELFETELKEGRAVVKGISDFANYEGDGSSNIGELSFYGEEVVEFCDPDTPYTIGFAYRDSEEGTPVIAEYTVIFTNAIKDKTPTAKANDKLTTHQELGLSLTLPKGVKAAGAMYYKIVAETEVISEHDFEVDGKLIEGKTNLNFWDYEKGRLVEAYRPTVTAYIPSSDKTAVINVMTDEVEDKEFGWGGMLYTATVQLVYACEDYDEETLVDKDVEGSDTFDLPAPIATKQAAFETKLGLTKRAPSKIYSGQSGVLMAEAKWSEKTTVKELEQVLIYNSVGNVVARWDRREGSDQYQCPIDVCEGAIYLTTYRFEKREYEEGELYTEKEYLKAGKYTLSAWAVGGPGVFPQASMNFQIVNGIEWLEVTAPATFFKPVNKKATFTAGVSYYGTNDSVPASKKVTWEIVKSKAEWDEEADDYPDDRFEPGDPLYGMLTVNSKGVVTLNAAYNLSPYEYENTFFLKATAADYEDNDVFVYSESITITSEALVPTKIYFRWWDDRDEQFNYSNITDDAIARGEKFYTGAVNYAEIQVLDQFGNDMEADIKVTGLKYMTDELHSWLQVLKPGKMTVKATARDGGKKSKTMKFTTVNTDGRFDLNTLIQDVDNRFINVESDDFYNSHQKGLEDKDVEEGTAAYNTYSGNSPIYVSVGGVWSRDYWIDDDGVHKDDFDTDYGNSSAIAHSISVKGGKITATLAGRVDHYITYEILPNAPETVITVKDNTVDKIYNRKKGALSYTYTVTNSGISASKAYTISANRKSIYGRLSAQSTLFNSIEDVPNRVTYTIKNAPKPDDRKELLVRLTMDNDEGDARNIAWRLGLVDERTQDFMRDGCYLKVENGAFAINYFDVYTDDNGTFYDFWDTAPGNYTFYATVGQAKTEGEEPSVFEPLGKMTKITVKVVAPPKPVGKFKTVKYAISDEGVNLDIATVTKGLGVKNNVFIHEDEPNADAYYTMSNNTNGINNGFVNLFYVENPIVKVGDNPKEGEYLLTERPVLKAKPGDEFWAFQVDVVKGKNPVWISSWKDLYDLKNGNMAAETVGTAAQQKAAYSKWAKANLTGYIGFRVVDYTGQDYPQYQKVTVNIDNLLEQYK